MLGSILAEYGIDESEFQVTPFGSGLINHTWKILSAGREYLLQKINGQIFKQPADIMANCEKLSDYFHRYHAGYLFVAPLMNKKKQNYTLDGDGNFYRLFPFIPNSYTFNTVSDPKTAFEAAKQFGQFTRLLSDFDLHQLRITLPDFHNLSLRQSQFEEALRSGNQQRRNESEELIRFLQTQTGIVTEFEQIKSDPLFPQRVVHHDAKINNVLFALGTARGLCVIDLDTVMPGYYFSDVGDMLRTYLSPAGEEEVEYSRVEIREEYFKEIAKGYLSEMQTTLTENERKQFVFAGKFAIYMQAIRFLTDFLNNDMYYSIHYPTQNFVRAGNQVELLKKYLAREDQLQSIFLSC